MEGWKTLRRSNGAFWVAPEVNNMNDLFGSAQLMFKVDANYNLVYPDVLQTKSEIISKLSTATAMFTNTHGTTDGMFESSGYEGQSNEASHFISWSEFKSATDAQTPIPALKYGPTFAYACSTLAGPLIPSESFNLRTVNSFYVGFTEVILPWSRNVRMSSDQRGSFAKHLQ
jgi:hypothetical protein